MNMKNDIKLLIAEARARPWPLVAGVVVMTVILILFFNIR
jgi:hypothetical protein